MGNKVQVEWQADDGYVGKSRPQHAEIYEEDLTDCEDEDAVRQLIEQVVQEDFEQTVFPEYDESAVQEVIETWKELRKQAEEEEEDGN